ncbi:MAG TPA: Gfo/Idh/MocA family oxidoreductase [Pirellulales bacterium]|jgi:predicted dehydrogenase|nr:Gfo/Idh/MocA family oxidoreductase [Pirellulales bacterium]
MRRRTFLKATASSLAVPYIVPSSIFGANAPSNRINVGFIGLGNQSTIDLPAFLNNDDVHVVAVCDVNRGSDGYRDASQFLGREPGKQKVDDYYSAKTKSGNFKACDASSDFRQLLSRDDIDAVTIIVPDHWHAIITIMAAEAGKDIYCEKPLSLTIRQGQAMVKAVRKHQRVLQTGSHWRSGPAVRTACELVRNGRIGTLQKIHTFIAPNNAESPGPGWKAMPVPDGFDYQTWLGPAPEAPYHHDRCFYRFRFILDYSGGQTTNFGAHSNDIAQWGHGSDRSGPVEFEDAGSEWPEPGSLFTAPTRVAFRARYDDGVEIHCQTVTEKGKPNAGARFEGSEGWVEVSSKGLSASSKSILTSEIGPNEIHLERSNPSRTENVYKNYLPDHVRNFLDCVKSRQDPIEPVEVGHSTATLCHLGNIAMRLKRNIKWNPEAEEIGGDEEAAAMLSRPMRAPWQL